MHEAGSATADTFHAGENRSKQKDPLITFQSTTFEDLCEAAAKLFPEYEREMCDLVDDYVEYCSHSGLLDPSPFLLRIMACGKSIELNKRYGIYFDATDRGYRKHGYVGAYANKRVQVIWKIDSVFDVDYDGSRLQKRRVDGRDTNDYDEKIVAIIREAKEQCGYNVARGCRFFCGEPVLTDYRKKSSGGLMRARFIDLRKALGVKELRGVEEIANRLKDMNWE